MSPSQVAGKINHFGEEGKGSLKCGFVDPNILLSGVFSDLTHSKQIVISAD